MNELVNADNIINLMHLDYDLENGNRVDFLMVDLEFLEQIQDKNKFLSNIQNAIEILKDFKNFYIDREIKIEDNTIKIKNLDTNKELEFELEF